MTVTTRFCCRHFFVGVIYLPHARNPASLLTNPANSKDHAHESTHPLRLMAQALVGGGFLSVSHNHLLSGWIERRLTVRRGLALAPRSPAIADRLRELQGIVRIQTLHPDHTYHLACGANGL
jgi:hypothetical protein